MRSNEIQWMEGMVKGYEGPKMMENRTMDEKDHVAKQLKCPIQRIGKMEGKMVGKYAWKWKYGAEAILWRKGRHAYFQSMYEHFVFVPLVLITKIGLKVE